MEIAMKKFFMLFAVTFLLFLVTGCGSSDDGKNDSGDSGDSTADTGATTEPTDTGDTTEPADTDPAEQGDTDPTEQDDSDAAEPSDTDEPEDPAVMQAYSVADAHAEAVSKEIVEANTRLGLNIFEKLAVGKHENIMISPLSISIAMAMTANGTENGSLAEMKSVLGYGEMDLPAVNEQFRELIASLVSADKDLVLEIANSIWLDDAIADEIKEEFIAVLEDSYDAELFEADFGDDATVELINSWVAEKTHGKIVKIIDGIGPESVMHLINAVYFKAAWSVAFNKDATFTREFILADGTKTDADYMGFFSNEKNNGITYGNYVISDQNVAGVRIPYGRDAFAFYAYVANPDYDTPDNEVIGVDEIIGKIAEKGLEWYLSFAKHIDYTIRLPKFKFEYNTSLKEVFESLGLEKLFGSGGMSAAAPSLYVSGITHKTYIDVNEEGTEAAAVTDIDVGDTGDEGPNRFQGFYGKRPFFFFIRDERNGTILFMGKVERPEYEE